MAEAEPSLQCTSIAVVLFNILIMGHKRLARIFSTRCFGVLTGNFFLHSVSSATKDSTRFIVAQYIEAGDHCEYINM
jgi:hypothetical protein